MRSVLVCSAVVLMAAVAGRAQQAPTAGAPASPGERIEVPPPPFSDGIFPCTGCHNADMPPNRTRRPLSGMHEEIVLEHDEEHRWCLDCHDADNRDVLHLASGDPVPFSESYRLCGQCHGEKYRDWRAGVHGRRVGEWNGHKRYLLCAHCHNPHQPRFHALEPKPAPRRPGPGPGASRQSSVASRQSSVASGQPPVAAGQVRARIIPELSGNWRAR